jgi:hypothetical protein
MFAWRVVFLALMVSGTSLAESPREWTSGERKVELAKETFAMLKEAIDRSRIGRTNKFSIRRGKLMLEFDSKESKDKILSEVKKTQSEVDAAAPILAIKSLIFGSPSVGEKGFLIYPVRVVQVIDANSMTCKVKGDLCWVDGISTAGITDDSLADLDGAFEVVGTKSYTTAIGGSNTVWQLSPTNLDNERLALLAKWGTRDFRQWTSANGKFRRSGALTESENGNVVISQPTGDPIKVFLKDLSKPDQEYVKAWMVRKSALITKALEICVRSRGRIESIKSYVMPDVRDLVSQ